VRFGGEVYYGVEMPFVKEPSHKGLVRDVAFIEVIRQIRLNIAQAFQVAGVGEFIQVDYLNALVFPRKALMKLLPMKPAPPVTSTAFRSSLLNR